MCLAVLFFLFGIDPLLSPLICYGFAMFVNLKKCPIVDGCISVIWEVGEGVFNSLIY